MIIRFQNSQLSHRRSRCPDEHAGMLNRQGWLFCPFCGIQLVVKFRCAECGRNFLSEKAYYLHLNPKALRHLKEVVKKHEQQGFPNHRIIFQKNRKSYFCVTCEKGVEG